MRARRDPGATGDGGNGARQRKTDSNGASMGELAAIWIKRAHRG